MQQEPIAIPAPVTHPGPSSTAPSSQHGPLHRDSNGLHRVRSGGSSGGFQRSGSASRRGSHNDVDAELLDEELRGLSLGGHAPTPGHRISEYENAMTPPTPRRPLGFKVTRRSEPLSDGVQLEEFPNEILTQILSHLHSDSHAAIALVSKRFYALITSSHAWRMAFLRYFPGHEALEHKVDADLWADASADSVQSEARYFSRLTPLASWRKEYLLRTRLLRSLARGKPGSSGVVGSSVRGGKKLSAVLTYNSKLPWAVTNIHAVFSNGKKPPRVIHGASDLGAGTMSDPTSGKVEKWGLTESFAAMQLDDVFPGLIPYGLDEGPAATPNVMDVSQPYGLLAGEGYPGGRAFYRPVLESRGSYLVADSGVADTYPDIPKIPEMSEAICSAWIAKSSAVPLNTQSMAGMFTGSTLGVVTSYAIVCDSNSPRHSTGEITARWVLSPGVPIIALKVDENYSQKRRSAARVWAVALNALGEVYYLTEVPVSSHTKSKGEDVTKNAWYAGRTVHWQLIESTRRVAHPDDLDKNATRGAYSPRSPSNSMNLSKDQMAAEAREIEKFLRHKPAHFRRVCDGWDMLRKLEVDFASDDGNGAGERIFVIDCGLAEDCPARVQRYSRTLMPQEDVQPVLADEPSPPQPEPSLFGSVATVTVEDAEAPKPPALEPLHSTIPSSTPLTLLHEWDSCTMELKGQEFAVITSSALDSSSNALLTLVEDPLVAAEQEIPGRRSRLLAVGTDNGAVLVWNARARAETKETGINRVRFIQTESPEVSCLALTGLCIVHGGSDGLVQAWDPLASTLDPVRTINARSNGRVPRHMTTMNPGLDEDTYSAVGAIYLDSDPTVLRGVVSFGAFLRYWAYSSTSHPTGRKRRLRHSDLHGRLASRRQGGDVTDYIAAEEAELRREEQHMAREQARLCSRFGVGALGDLTEEEALRYAQMVSEETFVDEQRRTSDSAADASLDTASTFSGTTVDTLTPEPSVTDTASPNNNSVDAVRPLKAEDDYEQQIQQAIRLSLMEGVNETDNIQSTQGNSSGEYEFAVTYKTKPSKKNKHSGPASPRGNQTSMAGSSALVDHYDDDLELALKLSMADQGLSMSEIGPSEPRDEFPPLESEGVGKGKGVQRW
ncbi:hypothetical protein B0J13DRAFT_670899 [Dactylonectria estremocensis]|uniref:F-box domain-containing protein n=1 Tax=Dactylonectria estremocensis TaxID=1079267 RepID=A0A9P9FCC4_9HYPO|nr:hypothetical protein B0J13DRAFT_670899 [Dactylonectria estremocensis]